MRSGAWGTKGFSVSMAWVPTLRSVTSKETGFSSGKRGEVGAPSPRSTRSGRVSMCSAVLRISFSNGSRASGTAWRGNVRVSMSSPSGLSPTDTVFVSGGSSVVTGRVLKSMSPCSCFSRAYVPGGSSAS